MKALPSPIKKRVLVAFGCFCVIGAGLTFDFYRRAGLDPASLLEALTLELIAPAIATYAVISIIAKHAEAVNDMRQTENLYQRILYGINDGVFDYYLSGRGNMSYSSTYKNLLGYSESDLGSTHDDFVSLVHPDDVTPTWETLRRYEDNETPSYNAEFRMRHKLGHWVWILSRGIGIRDENGKIFRLIGTHTDITSQKEREEALGQLILRYEAQSAELAREKERAEAASQAKSEFLSTMSHEIRTPLNAVIGLARLLGQSNLAPQQKEMVQILQDSADTLLQLVNDLLDLSRIEASQITLESRAFTVDSLFKTLHALFDKQASTKGLYISFIDSSGGAAFLGDALRIQQIIVNLIGNAIKFTDRGGITVTAEAVALLNEKAELTVHVADTGIGIAPEKLGYVFEKFVQADQTISRRFGGSGLGLAICKSFTKLMGGDISVSSVPGQGSIFTLKLPLRLGKASSATPILPQAPEAVPPQPEKAPDNRGTVLIVEDYAANILVASLMVEQLGFVAEVAKSGTEALAKIEATRTPYVAVLMDVQMPDMDGLETTKQLRVIEKKKNFHNYVIGATAHAFASDRDRCLEAGMDDYISKPIDFGSLSDKLEKLAPPLPKAQNA